MIGKNVKSFDVDMSSHVPIDITKKDILILGYGLVQGLDYTTLTEEKENFIKFKKQHKTLCLSLHYSEVNSYLFVNGVEIYKFKAKNSEINAALFCLRNVSEDFLVVSMKKDWIYGFRADYDAIVVDDILDIHKYLLKKSGISMRQNRLKQKTKCRMIM